jgi:adenylate cyclase
VSVTSGPAGRRRVLLIGIAPVLCALVLAAYRPAAFARVDEATYDLVVREAGTRAPAGRVTIVDVDERSLAEVGQWPWRRDVVGRLIASLRAAGASVVAIDVIFAESDRHDDSVSPDRQLAAVLRDEGVVLGYGLTFDAGAAPNHSCVLKPFDPMVVTPPGEHTADPFFQATGAVCDLPILGNAAPRSGFLNAVPDADGILRRIPLLAELDGRVYPSLALASVTAATGAANPVLRVATVNSSTLSVGSLTVPLDGRSNLLLGFRGKKRTFPYVSAVDALNGTLAPGALRGKIVLVGTTALGTREVVATPLDTQFVGLEVQATTIDNLLQRDFVHRPALGGLADLLIVLLAASAVVALVAASGVTAGLMGAVTLIAAAWWGASWLLSARHLFVSPLPPTIGVLFTLSVMTLARFTVLRDVAARASLETSAAQGLMVQTLLSLTETRDAETGRHSRRTQQYARLLAEPLSDHPAFREYLTTERIDLLSRLAPLHDIGKVGISDRVLNKPGALTDEELAEMRRHPELGHDVILRAESRAGVRDDVTLQMAKDIVYTHHERWDGGGYPRGLGGTSIPLVGRIMAVVDVYDATRTRTLYLPPLSHDDSVALIARGKGTHFDPDVVEAFLRVAKAFEAVSLEAAAL